MLNAVSVFVRHHVRLRERATLRAELRSEVLEEREIEIDLLVVRAIERSDLRRRRAAAGLRRTREEDGGGWLVGLAARLEFALPVVLDAVHEADDAAVIAAGRVRSR